MRVFAWLARAVSVSVALASASVACGNRQASSSPVVTVTEAAPPPAAESTPPRPIGEVAAGSDSAPRGSSSRPELAVGSPPFDACSTAADCAWGEINREIERPADCMCLYGCPRYPLAKTSVERRVAQHQSLCDPHKDGTGRTCPIDDCAYPGKLTCVGGKCVPVSPKAH